MSVDIPGWFDWPDIYGTFVDSAVNGAYVVECGTFFGKSAHFLATRIQESGKQIYFDTWDNWVSVPPEHELGYPGWTEPQKPSEDLARMYLSGLPVNVRTGDAIAAATRYPESSLDLVFLDDCHTTTHVELECLAWWPRVKPGGLMAGHDFNWMSVQLGVASFASQLGLKIVAMSARCWGVVKE